MSSSLSLTSQTIQFLRFPLMVGVVFIHTNFTGAILQGEHWVTPQTFPVYAGIYQMLDTMCFSVSVPLFALMAGYLFFWKVDFTAQTYTQKLKSRAKTLLVPYLFWNVLEWLLLIVANTMLLPFTSGRNAHLWEVGFMDWLSIFGHYRGSFPVNIQFWYIRDLMVTVLLSPAIYWAIKRLKFVFVVILGALCFGGIKLPVLQIGFTIPFFFSIGAYFSIHGKDLSQTTLSWRNVTLGVYALLWVAYLLLAHYSKLEEWTWFEQVVPLCSVFMLFGWVSYLLQRNPIGWPSWINSSVFFLYAYHGIVIAFCLKLWLKFVPLSELNLLVGFVVLPMLVTFLGVLMANLFRKIAPRFMAVITGGR